MSYRRVICAVLLPATLLLFAGCTKTAWVGPGELRPEDAGKLKGVVTAEGRKVSMEPEEATIQGDTLYADVSGEALRFALDDLAQVGVKRSDTLATVGLVLGITAAVAATLYVVAVIHLVSTGAID
jgi:hypothetical protein